MNARILPSISLRLMRSQRLVCHMKSLLDFISNLDRIIKE